MDTPKRQVILHHLSFTLIIGMLKNNKYFEFFKKLYARMQYDLHAKQIQDSGILVMYINHSWVIKWK